MRGPQRPAPLKSRGRPQWTGSPWQPSAAQLVTAAEHCCRGATMTTVDDAGGLRSTTVKVGLPRGCREGGILW
ncbi:hypothetical protein M513_13100 [Trichuris suis]|uniref:Uncharacterized protein n=1 Tax=Trichuris suis TaxID=68888 RepID=A0A085LM21_9BILA|nr:hypothetical protein M513_13100 [Trichuris suis]